MKIVNKIIDFVLKIIYPPKCIFCTTILEPNCNLQICGKCSCEIKFCCDVVCCEKCGKPIVSFGEKKLCYYCLNNKNAFNKAVSVFVYEDAVKKSLIKFKEKGLKAHRDIYVNCMTAQFFDKYSDIKFDFLCGVPAHNKSKDFDQVDLLCKSLSKKIGIPYKKNTFRHTRKTAKQSTLGYKDRQKNMANSLKTTKRTDAYSKVILLIDDICTTRSTLNECARALKESGAKKVYALTVATVKNPE